MTTQTLKPLDPEMQHPRAQEFGQKLAARIVGQDRAVRRMTALYQIYLAGLNPPGRPIGTLLFLGPTGSGKTRVVEASAEVLFGDPNGVVKIDCGEFQHSHEIAKLIGSPPGYLGHRETTPLLTQENLDRCHSDNLKLTFVLFDEIEKASDALWQLLLGILDKATLTLGDNRRVDFSRCIIVMTSNLGTRELSELISGGIGFAPQQGHEDSVLDQKIYRTALDAARRKFSPEFMNRIDKVVVFRSLKEEHLHRILDIELQQVQERILKSNAPKFVFTCTNAAKQLLLEEGTDYKYGARHLKRSIERFLVFPLSNLIATEQIEIGDLVIVDRDERQNNLIFSKRVGGALVGDYMERYAEHFRAESQGVGVQRERSRAASNSTSTKSH
ncbi:MAG: ATP-dependent Clp protease ATP-binding subunit [Acidobacteria bacterium]|nr:ATP-dependent Clp protease ATP-binding subunit [Acidobacteriota bacterium]